MMLGAAVLAPEAETALSQEAEATATRTQEAEAAVIARVGAQDLDLLQSQNHLLRQDHHPDPLLFLPGVTSLQAGVLPGARVCPDLVLRQNQSESDSALETFRKAELELKDCCTDYEHCASSIAVPSIFLQILCSLRRSLYATTLYLT